MSTKKVTSTAKKNTGKTMNRKKAAMKTKQSNLIGFRRRMSKVHVLVLATILAFGGFGLYTLTSSDATSTVNVKAATYNILGQHHDPTSPLDVWSKRKARVANRIATYNPGIIGLQEVTRINPLNGTSSPQRADVVQFMAAQGYTYYAGSNRNNSPIFWKKGTFTVLARKEALIQPEDSDAQGPAARYLTYVRLQKGDTKISVFNYHYNQWRDDTAQLERLKKYFTEFKVRGDNIIFTGDFNKRDLQVRNYTGLWRVDNHTGIDHVLASNDVHRISWGIVEKGDPAASDHPLIGVKATLY